MLSYIRHKEELPFRMFEGSRANPERDEEHGRGERDEEGGLSVSEGCCSAGEERPRPQQRAAASGAHCLERVVDTGSKELVDHGGCLLFKKAGAMWRHLPFLQIRCPYSKELLCSHKTQPVFTIPAYPRGYAPRPPSPCLELQIVLNPMYTMVFPKLHTFSPGGRTLWLPFAYPDCRHHASCALERLLRKIGVTCTQALRSILGQPFR